MSEQSTETAQKPLTALDYVQMWLSMTEHRPGQGHYSESRACRRKRLDGKPKDSDYRCVRCDGEALLSGSPAKEADRG